MPWKRRRRYFDYPGVEPKRGLRWVGWVTSNALLFLIFLAVPVLLVFAYGLFVLATIWGIYGPEGQPR